MTETPYAETVAVKCLALAWVHFAAGDMKEANEEFKDFVDYCSEHSIDPFSIIQRYKECVRDTICILYTNPPVMLSYSSEMDMTPWT